MLFLHPKQPLKASQKTNPSLLLKAHQGPQHDTDLSYVCLVLQESHVRLSLRGEGTACVPGTPAPATTPAAHDFAPSGSVWRGTAAWSWGRGLETSVRTPWRRCCPLLCMAANVKEAWKRRKTAWVSTGVCISLCYTVRLALKVCPHHRTITIFQSGPL